MQFYDLFFLEPEFLRSFVSYFISPQAVFVAVGEAVDDDRYWKTQNKNAKQRAKTTYDFSQYCFGTFVVVTHRG